MNELMNGPLEGKRNLHQWRVDSVNLPFFCHNHTLRSAKINYVSIIVPQIIYVIDSSEATEASKSRYITKVYGYIY